MSSHLDLEEQEQLDELKHFWKQYGNAITWLLIAVMGSYVGWTGYQYWERQQATKASALFDEVERTAASGDAAKLERSWNDMKERFPKTTFAAQSALLAAKVFQQTEKLDSAQGNGPARMQPMRPALNWHAFVWPICRLSKKPTTKPSKLCPNRSHQLLQAWQLMFKVTLVLLKTNQQKQSKPIRPHGLSLQIMLNTVVWLQPN